MGRKSKKSPKPAAAPVAAAPVAAAPAYSRPDSEGSGWMPQPAPAAPPPQAPPAGFDQMRGMANGVVSGMANSLGSRGNKSASMPPPQPQWSAASYEPSQFQNMAPAQAQAPWGGGRQMPQQQGNQVRRIPQQSSPTVQALRGGQ